MRYTMRSILAILLLSCAPMAFAGDTTDAADRPELGHQIKQAKEQMRKERKAARARFYAKTYEDRAKALRGTK
jgi:hypothetical protein